MNPLQLTAWLPDAHLARDIERSEIFENQTLRGGR
jgi:hypothetical protein